MGYFDRVTVSLHILLTANQATESSIEEFLHALFESHINMHSVCLKKFAKVNCFQPFRKYPVLSGAFGNNSLSKIWGQTELMMGDSKIENF